MSNVYAQVGFGFQQIGGVCPDGFIEMQSQRPDNNSVASETGEWVPAPIVVPQVVSKAQGKAALIQTGHWSNVIAYGESITDSTERALFDVALNDTTEYHRDSPALNAAFDALGLNEEDKDNLFILAASIKL